MSLVTIGLDFGTSSVKAVARPVLARNDQVHLLRSAKGALRWRSMLGTVRQGDDRGRLLLFDECDEDRWRFSALHEPNLKLALLVQPDAPVAAALESRWQCHYRALPTLLLAVAMMEAIAATKGRFGERAIHTYAGAPIAPDHPPEQQKVFERALFAADLLCERWQGVTPRETERAIREAERAWSDSESLPSEGDRRTFIAPEALAAFEGVASAGRRANLPIGRICVVDMGGGTTDIAWLNSTGGGNHQPLRLASLDIAGERIDAAIATEASRMASRRVGRTEVWAARRGAASRDCVLAGDGWAFSHEAMRGILRPILDEFAVRFRRASADLDSGRMKGAATRFAFVGGATDWAPLAALLLERLADVHDRADLITTSGFGLSEPHDGAPLSVALGLSGGRSVLPIARWEYAVAEATADGGGIASDPPAYCNCRGLLELCPTCGGSGVRDSEAGQRRFHAAIDPFRRHALSVRCPFCAMDFARDVIFLHTTEVHPETMVAPPLPSATIGGSVAGVRVNAIRSAAMNADRRDLLPSEQVLFQDLQWLRQSCAARMSEVHTVAIYYLRSTVSLAVQNAWWHLPRAIAFAMLEDAEGVERECRKAKESGLAAAENVASILKSGHSLRFVEALEHALS